MKKRIVITSIAAAMILVGCSASRPINETTANKAGSTENEATTNTVSAKEQSSDEETSMNIAASLDDMTDEEFHRYLWDGDDEHQGLFFDSLKKATKGQRAELLALERKYGILIEERVREIKTAMGEIGGMAPRLSVDDAMRICEEFKPTEEISGERYMWELSERFNEIAGAPDEIGGSGMTHIYYYTTDDGAERITMGMTGAVNYWNDNKQEGMVIHDPTGKKKPGTIIEATTQTMPETKPAEEEYFEECFKRATDEQKAKLLGISEEEYPRGYHSREIKTILGEIDENTPRLTKDKVLEICNCLEKKYISYGGDAEPIIVEALNDYAGAADIEGNVEIPVHIYYFDDTDHSKYITVFGFLVLYTDSELEIEEYIFDYSNR